MGASQIETNIEEISELFLTFEKRVQPTEKYHFSMRPPEFIDTAKANMNIRRESYPNGLNLNTLFTERSEIVHPSYFEGTRPNISADATKQLFLLEEKCDNLEKRYEEELLARANDIRDKQNLKRENQQLQEQVLYWKSKFEAICRQETEVTVPVRLIDTDDNASKLSQSKYPISTQNQSSEPAKKGTNYSSEHSSDKRSIDLSEIKSKPIPVTQNETSSTSESKTDVLPERKKDEKTEEELSRKERKRRRKEKRRQEREERRNARLSKESDETNTPIKTVDCSVVLSPVKTSTRIESPTKTKKSEDNLFDQVLDALVEKSEKEDELSDVDQNPSKKHKKNEHICNVCGKQWESSSKLKRHIETHNKTKPHKCKSCPAKFKTSKDLARHERRHEGTIVCGYCLATFGSELGLKHHQKTYH